MRAVYDEVSLGGEFLTTGMGTKRKPIKLPNTQCGSRVSVDMCAGFVCEALFAPKKGIPRVVFTCVCGIPQVALGLAAIPRNIIDSSPAQTNFIAQKRSQIKTLSRFLTTAA